MNPDQSAPEDLFAPPSVIATKGQADTVYLRSAYDLPEPSRCIGDWLVHWAEARPDAVFLAERPTPGSEWSKLSYGAALDRVTSVATWLMSQTDAGPDRPVAILSENAIDHAVLALAAIHVGIPVATISTAYSLQSSDHSKLKSMIELLDPGLIYVSDMTVYGPALAALDGLHRAQFLCSSPADTSHAATMFDQAAETPTSEAVGEAFSAITPDTVARLLFTSGSTGTPKAVINTHLMLTSNQEANRVIWPFLETRPPVIVDWLPWSHTFGCNFTSNMVLCFGGSLYIDNGKPAPGLIKQTVDNIKDVRPTLCFNVPRGYDMLIGELENDAEFRRIFFDMDLIFYAAAALPKVVWDRLLELSVETTGKPIPLVAAWGSTETAPLATDCHFQAETTGNIGVPIPGTDLKLVPNGGKLEVRVRGPNVTPGYYKNETKTREAFDDEGFYLMGDAVRFADPDCPEKGLFFDGRVSEDFKLTTGTWVSVGELRIAGIDALAPVAQDIVVTGHDKAEVGFLIFPNEAACRKIAEAEDTVPFEQVLDHPAVKQHVVNGLTDLKRAGGGSSKYAQRARLLMAPPNPDSGEITDKAYINQRQVLANRAADVSLLQGDDPSAYISV